GGAKSLQGGTLVATPLKGVDGQTYALAQGSLLIGGFSAGGQSGSQSSKNHTTVGRVPSGALVERDAPGQLPAGQLTLALRDPDFTTAARIVAAVNQNLGGPAARVRDPGAVTIVIDKTWQGRVVELIATLEA